jgi:hypothetical protein
VLFIAEETILPFSSFLAFVHGGIGSLDQTRRGLTMLKIDCDTDACTDMRFQMTDM